MKTFPTIGVLFLTAFLLCGCATFGLGRPYRMNAMPPPAILDDTHNNPFINGPVLRDRYRLPLLYATTRAPAGPEDKEPFYKNERGGAVRLGTASVMILREGSSWDDLTRFSERRSKQQKVPLYVSSVEEYGGLGSDYNLFPWESPLDEGSEGEDLFLYELNRLINRSPQKEIYLFVHGYNVNYEYPLLLASQFWHYMGYRGAFIAFSWPSSHKDSAYIGDLDTAEMTARALREFLRFLAEKSDAEKIHLIGHSVGARLITLSLNQISLLNHGLGREESQKITKLGSIILLASDMDRELFGTYLTDGILNTVDQMNIYISNADQALKASHLIHFYPRLGQKWRTDTTPPTILKFIDQQERLYFIDVSDAERIGIKGGHFYFTESPWVCSDFLTTLNTGRTPAQRGLVPHTKLPFWRFPEDYEDRIPRGIIQGMIGYPDSDEKDPLIPSSP